MALCLFLLFLFLIPRYLFHKVRTARSIYSVPTLLAVPMDERVMTDPFRVASTSSFSARLLFSRLARSSRVLCFFFICCTGKHLLRSIIDESVYFFVVERAFGRPPRLVFFCHGVMSKRAHLTFFSKDNFCKKKSVRGTKIMEKDRSESENKKPESAIERGMETSNNTESFSRFFSRSGRFPLGDSSPPPPFPHLLYFRLFLLLPRIRLV